MYKRQTSYQLKYKLSLLILCWATALWANDKEQFFSDMSAYYQRLSQQKIDLTIQYKLYNKDMLGTPYQTSTTYAKFDAVNKYIDNSQFTFYSNKNYNLVLYKRNKVASLTKNTKSQQLPVSFAKLLPDSTLFKYVTAINITSDTLGLRTYQLSFGANAEYKQWLIVYHISSHTIQSNTVYYKDNATANMSGMGMLKPDDAQIKPILFIQYTMHNWKTPETFFLATHIIQKKDKKFELTKAFAQYQFFDTYTKPKNRK